jgi:hypothetical protein
MNPGQPEMEDDASWFSLTPYRVRLALAVSRVVLDLMWRDHAAKR